MTNIATILTYIAFSPTAKADICLNSASPPELTNQVADAVHDHFDSSEGRSIIGGMNAFVVRYPKCYELQKKAPKRSPYAFSGSTSNDEGDILFSFIQRGSKATFLEENLARFPALGAVSRLDRSA